MEHRFPVDDLRKPYDRASAKTITKLCALTIRAAEHQAHDYYMTIGPKFSDPLARQVYAEIASLEEQHVTQYESIIDAGESWLEKWLLHEANEVYNYWSSVESEKNPRIRLIWERFLDYELGHFQLVRRLFEDTEHRDAEEIVSRKLPEPIRYESQREFVREVLGKEVDLRAVETQFVSKHRLAPGNPSEEYARQLNSEGSPTEMVAAGWVYNPGTELAPPSELRGGRDRRRRHEGQPRRQP